MDYSLVGSWQNVARMNVLLFEIANGRLADKSRISCRPIRFPIAGESTDLYSTRELHSAVPNLLLF